MRIHFPFYAEGRVEPVIHVLDCMKPVAKTAAFLFSILKRHTKLLLSLGHSRNTSKMKLAAEITLKKRSISSHLTILKQIVGLLAWCFGSQRPSTTLEHESFEQLVAETIFGIREVQALHELFKKLSNSVVGDGFIHKENFQLALFRNSKQENFFTDRVFTLFDTKKSGAIEFGEFVRSLSVFHPDSSRDEKVDFAFNLYDVRQIGLIEREEVEKMLIASLSESEMQISGELVSAILDKTFTEVDLKGDGKIDRDEWKAFVTEHPSLIKIMTLPYLKTVSTSFPSFIFAAEAEDSF